MTRHDMLISNIEQKFRLFEITTLFLPCAILFSREKFTSKERIFWATLILCSMAILLFGERNRFLVIALAAILALPPEKIKNKLTNKKIITGSLIIYSAFFVISIARLNGLSLESIYTTVNKADTQEILQYYANHEENIFFSMVGIAQYCENHSLMLGKTYLNTFIRLVPDSVLSTLNIIQPERVSVELANIVNPGVYEKLGLSYGAFYLAEIFWNFGYAGVLLSGMLIPILCKKIEAPSPSSKSSSSKVDTTSLFHYSIFINTITFVYYGSSNYVNIILYSTIACSLILLISKKRNQKLL